MKVLTANRLSDGEAVWFGSAKSWLEAIDDAEIARDAAGEEELDQIGKAAHANNEVIDVDLIDIELVDGAIRPIRLRERIRAAGPTIRVDLGKQARPELSRAA